MKNPTEGPEDLLVETNSECEVTNCDTPVAALIKASTRFGSSFRGSGIDFGFPGRRVGTVGTARGMPTVSRSCRRRKGWFLLRRCVDFGPSNFPNEALFP